MSPGRISRATLSSQLEVALREDILTGALRPGERLRTASVMARYGVSQTPLREALKGLTGEGLVRFDPRLGASVAPVSIQELHDLYDIRLLLESEGLARATARAEPGYLAELTAAIEQLRDAAADAEGAPGSGGVRLRNSAWGEAHRRFDMALFAGCGSVWLLRFIHQLYDHSERYRTLVGTRSRSPQTVLENHERLYEAIVRGDVEGAVSEHNRHWSETVSKIEEILTAELGATDARSRAVANGQPDGP
jgi:DNA-binding GntR family transcriptional regulator